MIANDPKPARFVTQDTPEGLRLIVSVPRSLLALLVIPGWLVAWAVALAFGIRMAMNGHGSAPFYTWLGLWTCCGLLFAYHWLWMVAGREIVTLREGALEVRRDILGVGFSREFAGAQITRPCYIPEIGSSWRLAAKRPSSLMFQYGKRTVEFARGLDEFEAAHMMRLIRQHTSGLQLIRAAGAGN
jgi:hypothetical protein